MGELPAGSGRRWEPPGGLQKHRDKIHRESKQADSKNLPFDFSKPPRRTKSMWAECESCGYITTVPVNTVGMICNECGKYTSVKEVVDSG